MINYILEIDKGIFHSIWYGITGFLHLLTHGIFKGIWSDKVSTLTGWAMIIVVLKAANELLKSASIIFGDSKIQKWYIQLFHAFLRVNYWVFEKVGIIWLVRNLNEVWHNIKNQKVVAEQRIMFQTEMLSFKENYEVDKAKRMSWEKDVNLRWDSVDLRWIEQKGQLIKMDKKIGEQGEKVVHIFEVINANTERIKKIEYENSPNSGGTTHDKISLMSEVVFELLETVKKMYSNIFQVSAKAEIDFDLMNDAAFIMDKKGSLIKANRKFLRMMGIEPTLEGSKLVLGDAWKYNIIPRENLKEVIKRSDEFIKNPVEFNEPFEYQNYKTGDKVSYMVDTKVLYGEYKEVFNIIGYVSEIK